MRPKNAFHLVLSLCLASFSHENQLEIEMMYLFVYNKIRSKISCVIKQFQVSSNILAVFVFGLTEVDTK